MRTNVAYSAAVAAGVVPKLEAVIDFADGLTPAYIALDSDDLAVDGSYVSDGSESSGIPLWDIVSRKARLRLYNGDGRYDDRDFTDARVAVYLRYGTGNGARMYLGDYFAKEPEAYGDFIDVIAYEDTGNIDALFPFADAEKGTQIGVGSLINKVCMQIMCEPVFSFAQSYESLDTVSVTIPEDSYTTRDLLVHLAMLIGTNVRIDPRDQIAFFYRYKDRSAVDAAIDDWIDLSAAHKPTTITGTQLDYTWTNTSGHRITTRFTLGTGGGYVVHATNNPFMTNVTHCGMLHAGVNGTVFHKMRCSIPFNPMLEFMDHIQITDSHGNTITTYITNVIHYFNGATEIQTSV